MFSDFETKLSKQFMSSQVAINANKIGYDFTHNNLNWHEQKICADCKELGI